MDLVTKLDVLLLLNRTFEKNSIVWGLGASALLYFKGIVRNFNDVDLMVSEQDVPKVLELLISVSDNVVYERDTNKARHFISAKIDGVDIDVIAGMKLYDEGQIKIIKFSEIYVHEYVEIMEAFVPLMSCKDWCTWYKLMGRVERVEMMMEKNHLW